MSQTAAIDVRKFLAGLIRGDAVLSPILSGKKVHTGQAPSGVDHPYVIIGPILVDTARGGGYYGQPGRLHRRRLTGWAKSIETAELIYTRLVALLDRQKHPLDGHTMVTGTFDFLAGPRQDSKTKLWGVDGDYTVRSLEAV